ncbi:O-antigen ligase [Synechococcus sp. WH 8109]|uniref:O-antigen ligase family protein n=1 Tax=Synechococcus sp. WH 8109 TaxID=166314 RepID=UPI001E28C2F9|nr:O-antigen ligase family protein [Synechococcus sp. WH 8109]
MLINACYIISFFFQKEVFSITGKSWINVIIVFWALYTTRLLYDVFLAKVSLSVPLWELLAWGLGSSLVSGVAACLFAPFKDLGRVLYKTIEFGVLLLGISVICFALKPGFDQGGFYLDHLNAITAANAGCSLVLLGLSSLIVRDYCLNPYCYSKCISFLGIIIGSFIVVFSATRGAILAMLIISLFGIWSAKGSLFTRFSFSTSGLLITFSIGIFVVVVLSNSGLLLDKVFTSRLWDTVLTRIEFWKLCFKEFLTSPFYGIGFNLQSLLGSLEIEQGIYFPHNYFFESLAIGGLLLTLPLLACFLIPITKVFSLSRANFLHLSLTLLAMQVVIYSMHNGHLGEYPAFWLILGLVAGRAKEFN